MNDQQLIELVRLNHVLYDLSHPKYMDSSFKMIIWDNIGKELEADGSLCKARWNNIRDNYRKSLKKRASKHGQAAKKMKSYKYSDQMRFITKFFEEKDIVGQVENTEEEHDNEEADEVQDDEKYTYFIQGIKEEYSPQAIKNTTQDIGRTDGSDTSGNDVPSKQRPRKPPFKRYLQHEPTAVLPMEYIFSKDQPSTSVASPHPVDAFLAGIAPTLKSLNPYFLHSAKSEIFATVQKYEMKMLMLDAYPEDNRSEHSNVS